jgi:cell division protein FtsA
MGSPRRISGLDIGTTKISAVIGEMGQDGGMGVVGVGISPSEGLRRGVVVNLEKTVGSIQKAIREAERMGGVQAKSVHAGIAGDHIRSINSRGVIAVSRGGDGISQADVDRVVEAAKTVAIPTDREIVHAIPQEFIVDDQDGIRDPIGITGVRLEAEVHIITGAVSCTRNLCKSIQRAGLKVENLVLEPLATSLACLDDDERNLGVVLLDIGGGTTDIAVFSEGSIRHTAVVGLGGCNITNDVAIGLRTPVDKAEMLKIEYGCALSGLVDDDETIEVPGVGGREPRTISRRLLSSMIEPRAEEILTLALKEVKQNHVADLLGAGVVLTGGTSSMQGVCELAEQVFDMPVRIGYPTGVQGLADSVRDPRYSTGVGLALYAASMEQMENGRNGGGMVGRFLGGFRRWLTEFD